MSRDWAAVEVRNSRSRRSYRRSYPRKLLNQPGHGILLGFKPDDVNAVINAATCERDQLLLRVLWATGARVSEALALRPMDVQRDHLVLPNRKNPNPTVKRVYLQAGQSDLLPLAQRQAGWSRLQEVSSGLRKIQHAYLTGNLPSALRCYGLYRGPFCIGAVVIGYPINDATLVAQFGRQSVMARTPRVAAAFVAAREHLAASTFNRHYAALQSFAYPMGRHRTESASLGVRQS